MDQLIKAILFDMDGLMVDTEPIYQEAWSEAAEEMGFSLSKEFFRQSQGRTNTDSEKILEEILDGELDNVEFRERWKEKWFHIAEIEGINIKNGLVELLEWLKEKDIPFALATSSNQALMNLCLEITGLGKYFRTTVYGQEVSKGKPEPDIYLKAAQRINTPPHNCLVLEDSVAGAQAGLAAGMQVIMIPDQTQPSDELRRAILDVHPDLHQTLKYLSTIK